MITLCSNHLVELISQISQAIDTSFGGWRIILIRACCQYVMSCVRYILHKTWKREKVVVGGGTLTPFWINEELGGVLIARDNSWQTAISFENREWLMAPDLTGEWQYQCSQTELQRGGANFQRLKYWNTLAAISGNLLLCSLGLYRTCQSSREEMQPAVTFTAKLELLGVLIILNLR